MWAQRKSRPKAALQFKLTTVDQAATNAGWKFRQYCHEVN
jgi:hypothetical protein